MLAQDTKQRIREVRGVLQGSLLSKRHGVEDPSYHQGRRRGEHAFLRGCLETKPLYEKKLCHIQGKAKNELTG